MGWMAASVTDPKGRHQGALQRPHPFLIFFQHNCCKWGLEGCEEAVRFIFPILHKREIVFIMKNRILL